MTNILAYQAKKIPDITPPELPIGTPSIEGTTNSKAEIDFASAFVNFELPANPASLPEQEITPAQHKHGTPNLEIFTPVTDTDPRLVEDINNHANNGSHENDTLIPHQGGTLPVPIQPTPPGLELTFASVDNIEAENANLIKTTGSIEIDNVDLASLVSNVKIEKTNLVDAENDVRIKNVVPVDETSDRPKTKSAGLESNDFKFKNEALLIKNITSNVQPQISAAPLLLPTGHHRQSLGHESTARNNIGIKKITAEHINSPLPIVPDMPEIKTALPPPADLETHFTLLPPTTGSEKPALPPNTPLPPQVIVTQISSALSEQINSKFSSGGDKAQDKLKPIVVQLSPAELGRVQIRFSFDGNERVVANIVAENPDTGAILKQKSDMLFAGLKFGGFENIDINFEKSSSFDLSGYGSERRSSQNHQAAKAEFGHQPNHEEESLLPSTQPIRYQVLANSDQLDISL